MFRKTKYYGMVWIFALAAGSGAVLAFLKPISKHNPAAIPVTAIVPVSPSSSETAAAPVTPVIFSKVPPKRVAGGAAKMPDAPVFVERANGVYEASTARYTALLSAGDGLRYLPKSAGGKTSELRVRLKSVTSGALALFDRDTDVSADTEVAVAKGAGVISYWRAPSLEECYEPRGDGIEQSFVLDAKPAGDKDLAFAFDMELKDLVALPARSGRNGGILFADKTGAIAVRYGQVMVRDAGGKSLIVEPVLDAAAMSAHFAIPLAWLDQAQYPIVIDPLVGSDFAVSNPGNSANNGIDQPTVCAGSTNYLVAWTDYSAGPAFPQIVGAVVTQAGVSSTPFAISSNVGLPQPWRLQRIECAFDGANWLLVWADVRQAGVGIYGAIVGSTGTLFGGTDFLIAATTGNVTEDPLVSFNGTNYLVAWTDTPPSLLNGSQVYYTFVNSSGVAAQKAVVQSNFTAPLQALEYVTSQRPNGDTLILYQELNENPLTHRSTRIQTSGVVLDPGGTALFREAQVQIDGTTGFGRPIGAVFNNNEWQILSSFSQLQNSAIFLHHLSLTGAVTPPTGTFANMGVGPIGSTQLDSWAPAFPGATEWLFLRNDRISNNVFHVLGKRVTFSGTDLDPVPFQIDTSTQGVVRSSVASQSGNLFLVAWMDGRNGAVQPGGDGVNIAASLVDASASGSIGTPLVATATASPTAGEAGVTVSFDSLQSTGTYTSIAWSFGDGTTSTLVSPSHIYKANGTYLAELALTNGAYTVFDTIVISVGTGIGPATPLGTPLVNTPPIVPGLLVTSVIMKLDFFDLSNDKATVAGLFDVTAFNNALTGLSAQVALGGKVFGPFALDAKGSFKSAAGASPAIAFVVSPTTGAFVFQVALADLKEEMSSLGMINATIPVNISVPLPVTVGVGALVSEASVGTVYHATLNKIGTANYVFQGLGNEISGTFLVTSFTAQEILAKEHTFTIKGQLVKPGKFTPNGAGNFNIYLGDYQEQIHGGAILNKGGMLTYTQKVSSGVKKFTFNTVTGVFQLQLLNILQSNTILPSGTGLPLAKSGTDIVKVNMNLSFLFDLSDGTQLSAGRFVNIGRTTSAAKSWKLR